MPALLAVSIPALAAGCGSELAKLGQALRGPGFFSCSAPALDGPLAEAYVASRRILRKPTVKGVSSTTAAASGGAWGRRPQRWWFTADEAIQWRWAEGHAGSADVIRRVDKEFAGVAAVLAGAAALALGLRKAELEGPAMLRVRRYAKASSGLDVGIERHVDYADFTLCHGDGEGLEAWDAAERAWCPLPPGRLHCLAGLQLQDKSAGAVRAAEHRVVLGKAERFSFCRQHGVVSDVEGGGQATLALSAS